MFEGHFWYSLVLCRRTFVARLGGVTVLTLVLIRSKSHKSLEVTVKSHYASKRVDTCLAAASKILTMQNLTRTLLELAESQHRWPQDLQKH